jgi:DNA repair exonuclease SbcCD ATPase subunit
MSHALMHLSNNNIIIHTQNDANSDTLAQALSKFDDLQQRYCSSMKKISQLERQLKEARQQNESLMEQLGGAQSTHSHASKYRHTEHQISGDLVFEKDDEEIKEKCGARDQRIKSLEKQNADLTKQVKQFEIDCHIEVEENQVLKSEIENLKRQLEALSSEECIEDDSSDEQMTTNYKKVLTVLRKQVGDLSDDLEKIRDHSREQSRQILMLRQQTEMTGVRNSFN